MKNVTSYSSFFGAPTSEELASMSRFPRSVSEHSSELFSAYSPTLRDISYGDIPYETNVQIPQPIYDAPRPRPPRSQQPPPVILQRRLSLFSSSSSMQYANGFSTLDILFDVPIATQEDLERNDTLDRIPVRKGALDRLLDWVASLYHNTRVLLVLLLVIMFATFICSITGIVLARRR